MRQPVIKTARTIIVVTGDPAYNRPALFPGNTIKMAQHGLAGPTFPGGRIDENVIKETDILTAKRRWHLKVMRKGNERLAFVLSDKPIAGVHRDHQPVKQGGEFVVTWSNPIETSVTAIKPFPSLSLQRRSNFGLLSRPFDSDIPWSI